MKRYGLLVLSLVAFVSFGATAAVQIVATHAVLGELAGVVGGDLVEVVTIIPSGFCPAHYDLSPSDYAALINADVVLYSGIEPWVESLADSTQEGALVQFGGAWNTPPAAVEKATAVAAVLTERIPEGAATFAANRDAYVAELDALGEELLARATSLGVSEIPVVCMQWQSGFVSWLGFQIPVTYGLPEGLSLKDLVELTTAGTEANAQVVIDNLQSGIEFGAKLAREIDAIHVVLSNFPGAMPHTATLLDLLARNAEAMFSAIEPME